ncbi:actin cytoskeleton-regulatory complex protein END3-domain-containing protein [Geopyxis carbonaria]|nr:actin cytoskeleton-regulatory complex protein END3-domain-containing protein [Geopyxis carbonaria]
MSYTGARKPISQQDIEKYWEIFSYHTNNGKKITGEQAASILRNSGLSNTQLEKIWDLADIDKDGDLDFEEFCVAMRLIYDVMNGDFKSVPATLPDFLVPESKAYLVAADSALTAGGETFERIEDEEEGEGLRNGFDWYMKPEDKRKYEGIYTANAGAHGQIGFAALNELYAEINVPDTEIARAWNLVNPGKTPTIAKDAALYFLHMLASRHEGIRLPRSVPPSLKSSFENKQMSYDIESVDLPAQRRSGPDTNTISGKKAAFGESYISRLGLGTGGTYKHSGTDFGVTKGTDWEEVQLKRDLADLETKIKQAETEVENRKHGRNDRSTISLVKRELEMMLEYKRRELRELDEGGDSVQSGKSIKNVRDDLDMVKEQVDALEQHLRRREEVLKGLMAEVDEERSRR